MNLVKEDECPLCLEDVSYTVASKKILTNINVKIDKDGITGIIGPSGSGKSTFLRLLNKLITPTTGKILFQEKNYNEIPARYLRKEIGLVQQRPYLFEGTVRLNLEYGPKIWNIDYSDEDLINLLSEVALPSEFLDRDVESLSGGEQQRVSLARAMANKPVVLLLDEPTGNLDIVSEEIVENTLKNLAQGGTKIIIVTHSLEQTKRLTNQLLFLKDGQLVEKTATNRFFQQNSEEKIRHFFKKKETSE
ncbi:MAG: ATP-binding cassette domain-containing protein [Candidatus Hermodarchaeota archaeon]